MEAAAKRNDVKFSLAILAGGESRRMGRNKALVEFGGRQLIRRVADALGGLSDDCFIVGGSASDYAHLGLRHAPDLYDLRASMVGIYSALAAARHEYCLVVSCDMPFVEPELGRRLAARAPGRDAAVPVSDQGLEPLFAVYGKSCMSSLRDRIERGDLAIKAVLATLDLAEERLAPDDAIPPLLNLNTAQELLQAESLLGAPPLVCIVGKKNSGKTTFIAGLVSLLSAAGVRVAFIKHDVHGFDMDREGTDTWQVMRAGAREVAISSPDSFAAIRRTGPELDLAEIYAGIGARADIVIAEGFKTSGADRIEISRRKRSGALACREEDLVAVISDHYRTEGPLPVFSLEDHAGVAAFLAGRYGIRYAGPAGDDAGAPGDDAGAPGDGDEPTGGRS